MALTVHIVDTQDVICRRILNLDGKYVAMAGTAVKNAAGVVIGVTRPGDINDAAKRRPKTLYDVKLLS